MGVLKYHKFNTGNLLWIGGKTYSVPEALHEIADHIKGAKEILDYPPKWDGEGALATDGPTFNHAAQFVLEYAQAAYIDHNTILTIHYIDIMRDGSASVFWESEKRICLSLVSLPPSTYCWSRV